MGLARPAVAGSQKLRSSNSVIALYLVVFGYLKDIVIFLLSGKFGSGILS